MTTETRPDLTELITAADTAWAAVDALTPIAAHDPDFVAYFATGGADDNLEEAIALRALLNSPTGVQGLKAALDTIVDGQGAGRAKPIEEIETQRFIRLSICSHDGQPRAEVCPCGETDPLMVSVADGTAVCHACGRQRNLATEEITPPTENVLAQDE